MPKPKKPTPSHNEYEIKDGCRIQQIRVTNGCRYYQVDLRNNSGKRVRKNFTNAKKACSFASKSMAKASGSGGSGGIKALQSTDPQREAVEILAPFNASLREAALFYAEHHGAVDHINSTKALIEQFIADYQNDLRRISSKHAQKNSTETKEAPLLASESTERATDTEIKTLQFPDMQHEAVEILKIHHEIVEQADSARALVEQTIAEEQEQIIAKEQFFAEEQVVAEQEFLEEEQFLAEQQLLAEEQFFAEERFIEEKQFLAEEQLLVEQLLAEEQVVAEEQVQTDHAELQPVSPVDTKEPLSLAWKPLYIPKNVKAQKTYTPSDVKRVMKTAKTELVPYLALGMFGGLRSTEILKLRWRDVDFKLAEIQVNANQSIVNGRRTVSMQSNLGQFLVPFRGKPKEFVVPHKQESLQRWTRSLFKELEIKTIPQGARHSFAMYHLASHPLDETMEELGYSESTPLHRYYRGLTNRRRVQAEKYFAIAPPNQADIIPIKNKAAA